MLSRIAQRWVKTSAVTNNTTLSWNQHCNWYIGYAQPNAMLSLIMLSKMRTAGNLVICPFLQNHWHRRWIWIWGRLNQKSSLPPEPPRPHTDYTIHSNNKILILKNKRNWQDICFLLWNYYIVNFFQLIFMRFGEKKRD